MSETTLDDALAVVSRGELELEGRLVEASNTTLRCWATLDGVSLRCVYKPVSGERPLWDFPEGTLAGREVAAYLVSAETGWQLVPPTVLRDGPLGQGACQLWIEEEQTPLVGFVPAAELPDGWHPVLAATDDAGTEYVLAHADDPLLARMVLFDAVVNNADRKGGHVLATGTGGLFGVDHGVSFHVEPKLRTVLWGWAGQQLPPEADELLAAVERAAAGELGRALSAHLSADEVTAVAARAAALRSAGRFPTPRHQGPAVPWPPV